MEIRLTLIYQEEKKIYQEEFYHPCSLGLYLKQYHATNMFAKVFREFTDKYWMIKQVVTCVMGVSGCAPVLVLRHVPWFSK